MRDNHLLPHERLTVAQAVVLAAVVVVPVSALAVLLGRRDAEGQGRVR